MFQRTILTCYNYSIENYTAYSTELHSIYIELHSIIQVTMTIISLPLKRAGHWKNFPQDVRKISVEIMIPKDGHIFKFSIENILGVFC